MSFVNVAPQLVSTAAADAARIGSAINTANTAAAATTQVLAAAQDEVSTAIAALFGSHGQHYQAISAQVAAYQQRFVLALSQAGSTYAVAEAASATPLQNVLDAINAPVQSLTGRPLIGDGANGIDGTGQAGGNGGWLWGNGGNGGSGAPGQAAGPAGLPGRTRPAVTAVAVQQPACPAGLTGPGRPVGAVADQRPPQQREGGRIDRVQQLLLHVGGLGARIRTRTRGQRPHELVVKRRRRSAQRLILLGVGGKHGRHRRRHLIGTGGQQRHRRGPGRRIGRTDSRPNTRQIRRRSRHQLRGYQQIRHRTPSRNPHPVQPTLGAANRGRGESPRSAQTLC